VEYLKDNDPIPNLQSAYRAMHSMETAVLKVLEDILLGLDSGNSTMLTLLDLSAIFNNIDHDMLLNRLHKSYGFGRQVLNWFSSYLCGSVQHIHQRPILHRQMFCMEYHMDRSLG